jgi:hypothetical protein
MNDGLDARTWNEATLAAGKIVRGYCNKCGGLGWVRGRRLDHPGPEISQDAKYSCDSEICRIADKIAETLRREEP